MLGMLGFTACRGSHPQKGISAASKPAVSTGPDEQTKAFPPDLDKNFPIFPGSMVEHVRKPKGAMREVLLSADAPLDKLIQFYKEGLQNSGYQITSALKMAARRTWSCDFHKAGQQASIMLFPADQDKSRMTIDLIYEMPSRETPRPAVPEEKFDIVGPGEIAQTTSDRNQQRN